mmetsp:Transcript_5374/g.12861  ORF Transcript_5374/g.12861 Transcript_5374/m.12861 type:complete len:240 (+) Transcript_5374:87-806(+)
MRRKSPFSIADALAMAERDRIPPPSSSSARWMYSWMARSISSSVSRLVWKNRNSQDVSNRATRRSDESLLARASNHRRKRKKTAIRVQVEVRRRRLNLSSSKLRRFRTVSCRRRRLSEVLLVRAGLLESSIPSSSSAATTTTGNGGASVADVMPSSSRSTAASPPSTSSGAALPASDDSCSPCRRLRLPISGAPDVSGVHSRPTNAAVAAAMDTDIYASSCFCARTNSNIHVESRVKAW